MTHPFLSPKESARMYQLLCDCPTGNVRSWAAKAGWTYARLRTFIKNLQQHGLAKVDVLSTHTLFTPLSSVANRCHPLSNDAARIKVVVVKENLIKNLDTSDGGIVETAAGRTIIELANGILARKVTDYKPIRPDNAGSHRAVAKWLELGIPAADIEAIVIELCAEFNPSKVNGQIPGSLAFFNKRVPNHWKRLERERKARIGREQLDLLPDLHVERGGVVAIPEGVTPERRDRLSKIEETDWRKLVARPGA